MATIRPTSISPSTTRASTGGDWTPYGYLSPMGGMDLLHQSVQWNTEEQIRQAQLANLRTGGMGGGSSYGGGGGYGSTGARTGAIASTGGGGGPAASMSALKELLKHISGAYGQVKTEAQGQYGEMLRALAGTTGQREADVRSSFAGTESKMMQQLARQGMSGTTIAPTMQMGVARERESALNRLADQMLGTKLGIMGGQTEAMAQFGIGEILQKIPIYQRLAEEKARGSSFGPVK